MKKLMVSVLLVSFMVLGFVSCGGGNTAFVGMWCLAEGNKGRYNPGTIELLKDGTGFAQDQAITWKTDKNRFYIIHPLFAITFDYKMSGNKINLTDKDGENYVYMRLGGDSDLVGTWEYVSSTDNDEKMPEDEDISVDTFNKDGTGITKLADGTTVQFKWSTDKNVVYTSWEGADWQSSSYKISGSKLVYTATLASDKSDDGKQHVYKYEYKKK